MVRPVSSVLATFLVIAAVLRFMVVLGFQQEDLNDWNAYYRGAERLRNGGDLYAEGKVMVEQNSYDYWVQSDGQYVYPPLLALALVPLTYLPLRRAHLVWLAILASTTLAAVWLMAWLLVRSSGRPLRPTTLAPVAAPMLLSFPLLLSVRFGQIDALMLLLLLLMLAAHRLGRRIVAGALLGIAVAVKPPLGFFAIFFLRKRRWSALFSAGAVAAILLGAPFALLGPGALADWLRIAQYFGTGDYASYSHNQSLRGVLLRAFVGEPTNGPLIYAPALAYVLWGAAVLCVLVVWWRSVRPATAGGRREVTEFALTASAMLLVSPLSEDIHYVALLPALAVLANRAVDGAPSRLWAALALGVCLYFAFPRLDDIYNMSTGVQSVRLIASGALLYGVFMVGPLLLVALREPDIRPPHPAYDPVSLPDDQFSSW